MTFIFIAIISVIALLIALTSHEYSHALAAHLLGDDTARRAGRLTLDPRAHIDPIGTILVPLIGILGHLPVFGWAKPVPYNKYNLAYGKWGPVIVSLAGPFANFVNAAVSLVLLKLALESFGLSLGNLLVVFLVIYATVNIVLGVFNFIPVHPLDGSQLINALLDHPKYRNVLQFLETKGWTILFVIIILDYVSPVPLLSALVGRIIVGAFSLFGLEHALIALR